LEFESSVGVLPAASATVRDAKSKFGLAETERFCFN
jgi:hypothetical protein